LAQGAAGVHPAQQSALVVVAAQQTDQRLAYAAIRQDRGLLLEAAETHVAFSAASFSGTPVPLIRAALSRFGAADLQVA
jgi:hypothetical protein